MQKATPPLPSPQPVRIRCRGFLDEPWFATQDYSCINHTQVLCKLLSPKPSNVTGECLCRSAMGFLSGFRSPGRRRVCSPQSSLWLGSGEALLCQGYVSSLTTSAHQGYVPSLTFSKASFQSCWPVSCQSSLFICSCACCLVQCKPSGKPSSNQPAA